MAIMEHVTRNGRAAPALPEHTFKDSGISIRFRKIGPATQQRLAEAILREFPKPEPPVVQTDLGDEPNPADPAHEARVKAWEQETGGKLSERMLRMAACEAEVAIDAWAKDEIARRKRGMEIAGMPWQDDPLLTAEENERLFFVLHIACATTEDLQAFGKAVTARSAPTEEAVQRHIATFPGDVPGAGSVQLPPDPPIGDSV